MECDRYFPSVPLKCWLLINMLGGGGSPERQKQDSHVDRKLTHCLWFFGKIRAVTTYFWVILPLMIMLGMIASFLLVELNSQAKPNITVSLSCFWNSCDQHILSERNSLSWKKFLCCLWSVAKHFRHCWKVKRFFSRPASLPCSFSHVTNLMTPNYKICV